MTTLPFQINPSEVTVNVRLPPSSRRETVITRCPSEYREVEF